VSPPPGYELPHGLYSLTVGGLAVGGSVTLQVSLPAPVPVGTVWLKLVGGSWQAIPIGSDDGDNVITITLTDGGQGDADGAANGVVQDPGGPAVPQTPTPTPSALPQGGGALPRTGGPWLWLAVLGAVLLTLGMILWWAVKVGLLKWRH